MPEKYVCIYLQILLNIHSHQFILIICHCAGCFFSNVNEISVFCFLFFFSGIRSWDTNLMDCNIDQELKLFVSRHSARFSADAKGKTEQTMFVRVPGNPAAQILSDSFFRHATLAPLHFRIHLWSGCIMQRFECCLQCCSVTAVSSFWQNFQSLS